MINKYVSCRNDKQICKLQKNVLQQNNFPMCYCHNGIIFNKFRTGKCSRNKKKSEKKHHTVEV